MSLRDDIANVLAAGGNPTRWLGEADRVLVLLRGRGQPMWRASVLSNEWVVDDDPELPVRFVLIDLGEQGG